MVLTLSALPGLSAGSLPRSLHSTPCASPCLEYHQRRERPWTEVRTRRGNNSASIKVRKAVIWLIILLAIEVELSEL